MVEYVSALYGLYAPEMKTKLEGQGMVEYALILVLVSVVAIVALMAVGGQISTVFNNIKGTLSTTSAS
jgi:pilus assembly protein Flp/PilA